MSATTAGATGGRAVWGQGGYRQHSGTQETISKHNGEQLNVHHFGRTDQKQNRQCVWLQVAQIRLCYSNSMRCKEAGGGK